MAREDGFFKIKNKTKLADVASGKVKNIPESDLCFQNEEHILQFEYVEGKEKENKFNIKPGVYTLTETNAGVKPIKSELRKHRLLESVDNTSTIINEAKTFFSKLHVYEKLGRPKKRGILLYSKPGMGKTSAITKICHDFIKEDKGTVIFNWPTSAIEADDVSKFLSRSSKYDKKCTRLILIVEDIGGAEFESERRSGVDSGLLNLLDGIDVTFKLPTFILATTNYPENLLSALADRPGRFDLMLELKPPRYEEKIKLIEFIAKRKLNAEEKEALRQKAANDFSIAHLEEIVVRSLLHDKTIPDTIKEMIEHKKKFQESFTEKKSLGLGI